jgi:hypothetical protein
MSVAVKQQKDKFVSTQLQPKIIGSANSLLSQTDFSSSENLLSIGQTDDD